jgi:hypothetical protein
LFGNDSLELYCFSSKLKDLLRNPQNQMKADIESVPKFLRPKYPIRPFQKVRIEAQPTGLGTARHWSTSRIAAAFRIFRREATMAHFCVV